MKSTLQSTQNNPADSAPRIPLSDINYYNLHIRKEGEKVVGSAAELKLALSGVKEYDPEFEAKTKEVQEAIINLRKKYGCLL